MKRSKCLMIFILFFATTSSYSVFAQVFDDDGKVIVPSDSIPEFDSRGFRNYYEGAVVVVLKKKISNMGLQKKEISLAKNGSRIQVVSANKEFNAILNSLQIYEINNPLFAEEYDDQKASKDTSIMVRIFTLYFPQNFTVDSVIKVLRKSQLFERVYPQGIIRADITRPTD